MDFNSLMMIDFLKKINTFDKETRSVKATFDQETERIRKDETDEWLSAVSRMESKANQQKEQNRKAVVNLRKKEDSICNSDIDSKKANTIRLQKCSEQLSLLHVAEQYIKKHDVFEEYADVYNYEINVTVDEFISDNYDFLSMVNKINTYTEDKSRSYLPRALSFLSGIHKKMRSFILRIGKNRTISRECSKFKAIYNKGCHILEGEIERVRSIIGNNTQTLIKHYEEEETATAKEIRDEWENAKKALDKYTSEISQKRKDIAQKAARQLDELRSNSEKKLDDLEKKLLTKYKPVEMAEEYGRMYSCEPLYKNYISAKEMPRSVHVATMNYDISKLELDSGTHNFLDRNYSCIYRGDSLKVPFSASFGPEFNYIFRFDNETRDAAVESARSLGMRLFTMLPPGKLRFTFIDPVKLGESFAMFVRLVDVDDRTSEVINGKIWSTPADIESKLKIMTDHISNVTQRCLQGKYSNIYEYNLDAEQNAEPYQVLMLMDFPAGMTENSLKLLEQISTSGPKCGVFTIIYRNESQFQKISERYHPYVSNIESVFESFDVSESGKIYSTKNAVKSQNLQWINMPTPQGENLDEVISILKRDIKNADKVVVEIEKVDGKAEVTNTTANGIRIPIGLHGANEVQYLTLGVGGSHHALIAGVAGSGKSSLLHTIILRTLEQYTSDELSLYLVDFKRGVEFKIYADFVLPSFKVVAIESEREFGYNILMALEREQKIRADIFKKNHVDKIEEYRELGKKMPRILVIMDEFHELFTSANDEFSKKSATIMERIVRQGRAFGVHLILASQSYSNISGVDKSVYDQMAVRIVLKCSRADADLLLSNGGSEIDQISIDDPGRAVYNSEAGNREYNSHFRVGYIDPKKHRGMLQSISDRTAAEGAEKTRILLSNIEDNMYCIFNQFENYREEDCPNAGSMYIGEPLSINNDMKIVLNRNEHSNILMIGTDTDKARSMFAFGILSLCINYWIKHRKPPKSPFIYLMNCKPLEDSYFSDTPKLMAKELLPAYVKYVDCESDSEIQNVINDLHDNITEKDQAITEETDKYLFVFGYQRAEALKSEAKRSSDEDIFNTFNLMPTEKKKNILSPKETFKEIVQKGSQKGVHTVLWQDSFSALEMDDKDFMSFFAIKIAFDLKEDEYSRFVGENDVSLMSENNAIYYSKTSDNQKFRPYQNPDDEWLKDICKKMM